jgi:hypothetical protein
LDGATGVVLVVLDDAGLSGAIAVQAALDRVFVYRSAVGLDRACGYAPCAEASSTSSRTP